MLRFSLFLPSNTTNIKHFKFQKHPTETSKVTGTCQLSTIVQIIICSYNVMSDFFEKIQLESNAESTKSNDARRKKKFKIWLQQCHPSCWDDENIFQVSRVETRHICEYQANSKTEICLLTLLQRRTILQFRHLQKSKTEDSE